MTLLSHLLTITFVCVSATVAPTVTPTSSPSVSLAPSLSPSTAPSVAPSTSMPTTSPTKFPTPSPTPPTSGAPTSLPTIAPSTSMPTNSPSAMPTSVQNVTTLPVGVFQTGCTAVKTLHQRFTFEITSDVSRLTTEFFLSSPCTAAQADAILISTASHLGVNTIGANLAELNVYADSLNVTVNNGLLVSLLGSCDGGGWAVGQSRLLNDSCVVLGLAMPAPSDCPIYYSTIAYNNTVLETAELYKAVNGTIICSPTNRFTNISAMVYQRAGSGASSTTCEPISQASVCAPFIDYNVSVPVCQDDACSPEQCQKLNVESKNVYVSVLTQIWSILSSAECRTSVARMMCATVYPRCGPPAPLCSCDLNCSATDTNALNRLLSLLGSSTSALCPGGAQCNQLPAYPALPVPGLENAPNQSALAPTPLVAYPTCAMYNGVACRGLVDYSVYVPKNTSLYLMEKAFEEEIWFAFGVAPKGACYDAFTKMACASVFTRCDVTSVNALLGPGPNVEVPLPRLPCRSLCEMYNETCGSFIALAPGALSRNCLAKGDVVIGCNNVTGDFNKAATGADNYPENQTIIEATINLRTTCNDITVMGVEAPPLCPYPFVLPENPTSETINDGYCALPCPATWKHPFATPEWNKFFSALLVLSCLCSVWTVLTYVLFRSRLLRTQTQIYGFHTILNVMVTTLTSMPAVFIDPSTAVTASTCLDNTREMTFYTPHCAITGIITTFTTSASCLFLTAFIIDLWLVVSMTAQKWSQEYRENVVKGIFIGIYSYAVGFVILAVAMDKIHQSNMPFCFVYDWVGNMFYVLLCISLTVDCVFFALIVRIIMGSYRQTAGDSSLRTGIAQFRRPIAFTVLCMVLFVLAAAARLQSQLNEFVWKRNAADWILCKVVRSRLEGEVCTEFPIAIHPAFLWLAMVAVFCQGLFISTIFGFSTQNFTLWKDLIVMHVLPRSFLSRSRTGNNTNVDSTVSRESSTKGLRDVARQQSSPVELEAPPSDDSSGKQKPSKASSIKTKKPKSYSRGFFVQSSRKVEFVPFD